MYFNRSALATKTPNTAWKADGFINLKFRGKQLGRTGIPLRKSYAAERQLLDYLSKGGEKALETVMRLMQFTFNPVQLELNDDIPGVSAPTRRNQEDLDVLGYINAYLPDAWGELVQLGFVKLRAKNLLEERLFESLTANPEENLKWLVDRLEATFQLANTAKRGFALPKLDEPQQPPNEVPGKVMSPFAEVPF